MSGTTALLRILEPGGLSARWNFPAALGTAPEDWGGLGTGATVTYSFMQALPGYEAATDHPGFQVFDASLQDAARRAFAAWAGVADLTFIEVPDAGDGGAIRLGRHDMQAGGYAYFPEWGYALDAAGRIAEVTPWARAGDVWLSTASSIDAQAPSGYGAWAVLHEIGHALGLQHPSEGAEALPPGEVTLAQSVMAYDVPPNMGVVSVSGTPEAYRWVVSSLYPSTPMPDDIAALQTLYGPNQTTQAGDTVHAWAPGERFLQTIWDAGGTDVIDAGNQVLPSIIDLREGQPSSIGLRLTEAERRAELPAWAVAAPTPSYDGRDNLWIAWGVTIEAARGGAGDDWLFGNAADNLLIGGGGWDTAGLPGPAAATQLLPQADGSWLAVGPGGTDRLQEIEAVLFEDGAVTLGPWLA